MAEPSPRGANRATANFRSSQKGQGAHPAVVITTLVALAGAIIFFAVRVMIANQPVPEDPPVVESTTDKEYSQIKKKISKAMQLKGEADRLKVSEDIDTYKKKCEAAKKSLLDAKDSLDAMLISVRDENGELPAEYSHYSQDYDRVNKALIDIIKSSPF